MGYVVSTCTVREGEKERERKRERGREGGGNYERES